MALIQRITGSRQRECSVCNTLWIRNETMEAYGPAEDIRAMVGKELCPECRDRFNKWARRRIVRSKWAEYGVSESEEDVK